MQTFKEYLITESQYDNIVIEPNDGRGRGVVVYGYTRNKDGVERTFIDDFNTLADAKTEFPSASVTASEEEEETNAPAFRDRSIEFDNDVKSRTKPTLKDDLKSSPGIKRSKQRYNRFKRRSFGEQ